MKKSVSIPMGLSARTRKAPGRRRRFHLMLKPIGAACNLDCDYCYYLHKESLLGQTPGARMDENVLEKIIAQYVDGNDADEIVFSWQGGEPTLLGIPFFETVVRLQARHAGRRIANTLQTNGTLLDDAWAEFLAANRFRVGLSLDGPEELHDRRRRDKAGAGTFRRAMKGLDRLRARSVPYSALATVNRENAREPLAVYRFLTEEAGADYIQFNPCAELKEYDRVAPHFWDESRLPAEGTAESLPGSADSAVTDWSVDADDWGVFLCRVFDAWLENGVGRVLVNWFETAVAQTLGLPAQICPTGQICGKGLAVEHDGSVYSCDHYVYPEYRLGHIDDFTLADMALSERQKTFAFGKRDSLPKRCLSCPHGLLCWGQCPRHRFLRSSDGETGIPYLCRGWRRFYSHAKPALREIAKQCRTGGACPESEKE